MKARIELLGPSIDVTDIINELAASSDMNVEKEGDKAFLVSTILNEADITELRDNYLERMIVLNGISKFLFGNHKTVSLGHAQVIQDDGSISAFIYPAPIEARSRMYGTLTDASGLSKPGKTHLALSEDDQTLKEIFKMIEIEGYSWVNMYRIYETLKEKVGDSNIGGYGISNSEIRLFTQTANNKKAIGFQARHGHSGFQPPAVPMTPKEAAALINKMIQGYIQSIT